MQSSNFDKINFGRKAVAKQTIIPGELCVSFSTFFGKNIFYWKGDWGAGGSNTNQVTLTEFKICHQA